MMCVLFVAVPALIGQVSFLILLGGVGFPLRGVADVP